MNTSIEGNKNPTDYRGYFGDRRLEARGTKLSEEMINKEKVILNQLANRRSELVGASRFFDNDKVSQEALINEAASRCKVTAEGMNLLCIQDTSEINWQRHVGKLSREDKELGPVGNNRDIGFFIHPMLVSDAQNGFPSGFSDIHVWNRKWDKETKYERKYKVLPIEEKESYRRIESSMKTKELLCNASCITIIADREADIYEEFIRVPDEKTHLLIRSLQNRILYDRKEKLSGHLSGSEKSGTYKSEIKNGQKKRKPGEAVMEVRYSKVRIARPEKLRKSVYPEYVELYVTEAKESPTTVPDGEEPVLWRILTTHEISNLADAVRIIYWYSLRWQIEQLFRTLKSQGLNIESSQIESGKGLKKLAVMALNAALRIMQLVADRDGKAGKPGSIVFSPKELIFLKALLKQYEGKTDRQKNPFQQNSLAWAAWIIARTGGWKGYRRADPAGPITMKRGLEVFSNLFKGWMLHEMCA